MECQAAGYLAIAPLHLESICCAIPLSMRGRVGCLHQRSGRPLTDGSSGTEDIVLLETRAVLRGQAILGHTEPERNMRQLMLCDSVALTLAVEKLRYRSSKLFVVIGRVIA